ncbi:MAG: PEP-CTERM sorting domain-containing protein, partial [Chroococcales cyanobacterium metabat2.561]
LDVSLVHTPEPTSVLSLFALGTLGAASTLKRQIKPSQSEEKETTKVG